MTSTIIGVAADLLALLTIWIRFEQSMLWEKLLITLLCIAAAVAILVIEKSTHYARVIDYSCEAGMVQDLWIHRSPNISANSLVGVYHRGHRNKTLSAIGYTIDNNDNLLQLKIVKVLNDDVHQIGSTRYERKDYVISSQVNYSDIEQLLQEPGNKE